MLFLRRNGVCATNGGEGEIGSGISVEWGCEGCDDVEWEGIGRSTNTWFVKSGVEGRDDGKEGSSVMVVGADFAKKMRRYVCDGRYSDRRFLWQEW